MNAGIDPTLTLEEVGEHLAQWRRGKDKIDRTLVDQAARAEATAVWMELERPDGMRLRIRPTHSVDMLALVERFMGA